VAPGGSGKGFVFSTNSNPKGATSAESTEIEDLNRAEAERAAQSVSDLLDEGSDGDTTTSDVVENESNKKGNGKSLKDFEVEGGII
jgi:hypothetical protein